jgi:phosphonate transport system substrate-binding protein
LSGVLARRSVAGSRAIAQGEEDLEFVTYFIANTRTGIEMQESFPNAIGGKTFSFGSKGSTSGRLMPEYFIRKHLGKGPSVVFRRVGFSGDHSKTLALVQSGGYEVGAMNYKVWENEMAAGSIDTTKVRVIWKTPAYPDYNWTIRGDVDATYGEGFADRVKAALLKLDDRELLDAFPRTRFIEANNSMYDPILDTAINVGIIEK